MSHLTLRDATRDDIGALIMPIERASHPAPWSERLFADELDKPMARVTLAERAGETLGFIVHWVVLDEAHILNVAVAPSARGSGVGGALLDHAIERARRESASYVTLEVRASNLPALGLYRSRGFRQVSLRRSYYSDSGEDAVVLGLLLESTKPA